jgi:thiol-disulfide isomerase/thioredoxin
MTRRTTLFCLLFLLQPFILHAQEFDSFFYEKPKAPPAIMFQDKEGKLIYNPSQFKGKVILINLWATWCRPCVDEMPSLSRLQEKVRKDDIYVLPVSIDTLSYEAIEAFLKKHKATALPALKDYRGSFRNTSVRGLPATLIINAKGQLVAEVIGAIEWDNEKVISRLKSLK